MGGEEDEEGRDAPAQYDEDYGAGDVEGEYEGEHTGPIGRDPLEQGLNLLRGTGPGGDYPDEEGPTGPADYRDEDGPTGEHYVHE